MPHARPTTTPSRRRARGGLLGVGLVTLATTSGAMQRAATAAAAHHEAPRSATKPVSYWTVHPCALWRIKQVEGVFHSPMQFEASPNAYGGRCAMTPAASVALPSASANASFGFTTGPVSSAERDIKGSRTTEAALGHAAVCIAESQTVVAVLANVGDLNGAPEVIDLATSSCAAGVALVKIALAHIA